MDTKTLQAMSFVANIEFLRIWSDRYVVAVMNSNRAD